jgi:hypothetical protein
MITIQVETFSQALISKNQIRARIMHSIKDTKKLAQIRDSIRAMKIRKMLIRIKNYFKTYPQMEVRRTLRKLNNSTLVTIWLTLWRVLSMMRYRELSTKKMKKILCQKSQHLLYNVTLLIKFHKTSKMTQCNYIIILSGQKALSIMRDLNVINSNLLDVLILYIKDQANQGRNQ